MSADRFESVATLLRLGAMKKTLTRPPQPRTFQPTKQIVTPFNQQPDMMTPIEDVEKEPKGSPTSTPQDWLKPKIFRGGGGLV